MNPVLTASATLAATAASSALLTYAALSPASQLFGATLIAGRNTSELALTYDDGPNPACTPALLDLLAEHNVRATFFMIGSFVRAEPALAARVQAAGHLIGNHTETHPWLAWHSARTIREELHACNAALEDTLGASVRYFRPPHGARRPYVLRAAAELGLITTQWNAMGKDWLPLGEAAILANLDRAITRNRADGRGTNMLLHDGGHTALNADRSATVAATRTLLQRETQSRFVTVDAWNEREK